MNPVARRLGNRCRPQASDSTQPCHADALTLALPNGGLERLKEWEEDDGEAEKSMQLALVLSAYGTQQGDRAGSGAAIGAGTSALVRLAGFVLGRERSSVLPSALAPLGSGSRLISRR